MFQEPVKNEADIIKFCEESGLPVALDETIDSIQENPLSKLMQYTHPGIVAIVSGTFLSLVYFISRHYFSAINMFLPAIS